MLDGPLMADVPTKNFPQEDPVRKRRAQIADEQVDSVTFTHKGLSLERLKALKAFLIHASADEIAAVRKMYGEMPEVLRMIGLEMMSGEVIEEHNADGERI
jgi:hypothetical protein